MTTLFRPAGPPRFAHQRRGLEKVIATRGRCALLFDPGLGKTAVVLDYLSLLALKRGGEVKVLIVCPLVAVDTWVLQTEMFLSEDVLFWAEVTGGSIAEKGELLAARGNNPFRTARKRPSEHPRAWGVGRSSLIRWRASSDRVRDLTPSEGPDALGDGARVVLEVVNIDTMARRDRHGSGTLADHLVDAVKRYSPDVLVVDESHKIKGATGNASRLLGRIAPHVPRRLLLSGTVMPHSPLDVFGQWRVLDPYAFGQVQPDGSRRAATFGNFKQRFAVTGGWMGREVVGYRNLDEMQSIMAQNATVARKADALDLPPVTDVVIPVNLSSAEQRAYVGMKSQLQSQLLSGVTSTVGNRLTQMLRLRQITSGHLPDDLGRTHVVGTSKAQVIKSLVQDTLAGEKRIVIFCFFSHEIATLTQILADNRTEVMRIEGGTTTAERMAMRLRFGSDAPERIVMVAQIKTMSLAVNELVTANHAIFGSMSQQRDDYVQARDRLNRIGQTKPITFWHAIAPGTVDQVILDSHNQRGDLETAMLHHIRGEENSSDDDRATTDHSATN